MSYVYDVFVSYRRHLEWTPWARQHLRGLLDAYLTQDLGKEPEIFIDEQIEPGADWPNRLGYALGRSRVLLTVFSRDYFSSAWCVHELDLMYDRLCQHNACQLILTTVGHDGEMIPKEIARIQPLDLKQFRNTDLQRKTPRFEEFSEVIKTFSPSLAKAIESAPPFNPKWEQDCKDRFNAIYQARADGCAGPILQHLTLKTSKTAPQLPPRVIV